MKPSCHENAAEQVAEDLSTLREVLMKELEYKDPTAEKWPTDDEDAKWPNPPPIPQWGPK